MNKMRISKKLFVLISIALPLQIAFSTVSAQDSFIVCDYKQSLIEIVPDSFICGYTFSPSGYKPYGLFLQKDSAGYQMLLNSYKYDRDKVDTEMSSATMRLSEWEVESELEKLINNAKKDLDNAKQREKADADAAKDDNVVKVLDNLDTEDQRILKTLVGELDGIKDSETVNEETKSRVAALATKLSAGIKKTGLLDKVLGKK